MTQKELADQAGCSVVTIRKLESDERKPSKQLAELLGACLNIPEAEQSAFIAFARNEGPQPDQPAFDPSPWKLETEAVQPQPATRLIAERFEIGDLETEAESPPHNLPRHNLPPQPTAFIGRETEIAEGVQLIRDEADCRLLTLLGPGGIGKTRLALQVAAQVSTHFADGVYFIPLVGVSQADFIVSAIVKALKVTLANPDDPTEALFNYLQRKRMLLVLDNFEHLMAGAPLLSDLIVAVPQVTLLVTSRERLKLQEEWLYEVVGLTYPQDSKPPSDTPDNGSGLYSALDLFSQRARRLQPKFSLKKEWPAVVQICQFVDGMPLGVELAASWLRMITCAEIVQELKQSLELLSTTLHNVPTRHQSIHAVFDYSWQLLSPEEQRIFRQLSIFQGGFERQAAASVAEASLLQLMTLIDRSMVRRTETGRYEIHELLRQYGLEKLQALPDERTATQDRYCIYYASFLGQCEQRLKSPAQLDTVAAINADIENIRAAWQWGIQQRQIHALGLAAEALGFYYEIRSWYQEGYDVFSQALRAIKVPATVEGADSDETMLAPYLLRGTLLMWLGVFTFRLGRYQESERVTQQSLTTFDQLGIQGQARKVLDCVNLGNVLEATGRFEEAKQIYVEGMAIAEAHDDHWGLSMTLQIQGCLSLVQGDLDEARHFFLEVQTMLSQLGQWEAMFIPLNLGEIAYRQGDYHEVQRQAKVAFDLAKTLGNQMIMNGALQDLGKAKYKLGDYAGASQAFQQTLQGILAMNSTAFALGALVGVARLLESQNEQHYALELLSLIEVHPASTTNTKAEAEKLTNDLTSTLPANTVAEIKRLGQTRAIWDTINELLTVLPAIEKRRKTQTAAEQPNISHRTDRSSPAQSTPSTKAITDHQRFTQESLIATGGMGEVYLGRDTETGQQVAIKRLKPELVEHNAELTQRLIREGELLHQLDHPNIVKILATFEQAGQPRIVMAYVPGGSLRDLLDTQPQLPLNRILALSLELADALTRAHHLGIIHRDLKPANVLLAEDGRPCLTDFGIAYWEDQNTRLTQSGTILGTMAYLSPEACLGEALDARSDIWAFGALLFEMLTGQPPFEAKQMAATLTAILTNPLPDLSGLRPGAPPLLVTLTQQMLTKDRAQRVDSMRQVAAALEAVQRSLP